jgi:hypothetical protein
MIYRRSQENIYAPGGCFEKEASQRWKEYILFSNPMICD